MSKVERKHEIFILEMIKHGDQVMAYMAAYPKSNRNAARVSAHKLLQKATIQNRLKQESERIKSQSVVLLRDTERKEILDSISRQALLSEIALGNVESQREILTKDANGQPMRVVVKHRGELNARIKALDILNKMTGDYRSESEKPDPNNSLPNTTVIIENPNIANPG